MGRELHGVLPGAILVAIVLAASCGPAIGPATKPAPGGMPPGARPGPPKGGGNSRPPNNELPANEPALSDPQLAALDAAFRDHIAALKEVDEVLRKAFEDPVIRLPEGALDGPGRRAVETRKKLLALIPPPPMPPVLRHEPTPLEAVMMRYRNEMVQMNGGVVFRLKNAAALAGTPKEQLLALAAELEAGPGGGTASGQLPPPGNP